MLTPISASSISSASGKPLTAIAPTTLSSLRTGTPPPQPVNWGSPNWPRFRCEVWKEGFAEVKIYADTPTNPYKGRQYPGEVIVTAVRWYLRYPLAYEHVAELLAERGLAVDASSVCGIVNLRWRRRCTGL